MNNKGQTANYILGGIAVFFLLVILTVWGTYNSLVNLDVSAEQKWGNIQSAYERRADLIPNLVETVRGAKNFEKETQTQIAELRSQAGQVQSNVQSASTAAELEQAGANMGSILSRLMVIVEAYPDLKSNQNFLSLQDELAGTENRIKYERDEYNTAVKNYKQKTRTFPSNMIANMFGFNVNKWSMFEATPGAEKAPNVSFN